MSEPAGATPEHLTYGDLRKTPEGERWELIDGVAYDMSAPPARRHQRVSALLEYALMSLVEPRGCEVYDAPFDVRLPGSPALADDAVDTVVQPDLVVICDPEMLDEAGCRGAPDLVVEILSPRTSYKDQTQKLDLYDRSGVGEYWIVNPDARWVMVYTRPASGSAFGKPSYYRASEAIPLSVADGALVELESVLLK